MTSMKKSICIIIKRKNKNYKCVFLYFHTSQTKLDATERGAGGFGSTGVSLKETNGAGDAKPANGVETNATNGVETNGTKAENGAATNGTKTTVSS